MSKVERHPNLDLFVADIIDVSPKSDRPSMEHPLFSLSKNKDVTVRHYEHNGNSITITPSVKGMATIWDKDVLIYCMSQLVEAKNRGAEVSRTISLNAYELLVATNRSVGGKNYQQLQKALERLVGTRILTNIETNGVRVKDNFGLIEGYKIVEQNPDGNMSSIEITLSEWFYNAVQGLEVLTLNRDYFRLTGGLERALYLVARKHCGRQPSWKCSLDKLHKKVGSVSELKEFRRSVKSMDESVLPGYLFSYSPDDDSVKFFQRSESGVMSWAAGHKTGK